MIIIVLCAPLFCLKVFSVLLQRIKNCALPRYFLGGREKRKWWQGRGGGLLGFFEMIWAIRENCYNNFIVIKSYTFSFSFMLYASILVFWADGFFQIFIVQFGAFACVDHRPDSLILIFSSGILWKLNKALLWVLSKKCLHFCASHEHRGDHCSLGLCVWFCFSSEFSNLLGVVSGKKRWRQLKILS